MAQFCIDKQIVDCWEKAAESCESEILDLEFKSISFGFDGMEYPIGVLEVAEPTYFKQVKMNYNQVGVFWWKVLFLESF